MTALGERLPAWAEELVSRARVARLGTVGSGGQPHLVPVCYAFLDGRFFVPVDEKPKRSGELARVRNLRRDPRATLLIDHYDDDWSGLAWVRFDCHGSVLDRGSEQPGALAALRDRYPQYREMGLEALPLLVFDPERTVAWRWET